MVSLFSNIKINVRSTSLGVSLEELWLHHIYNDLMNLNDQYLPKEMEPRYESLDSITERLAVRIIATKEKMGHRPCIIGIDGPPAAGKSTLTRSLAKTLETKGRKVQVIHIDHFLHVRHTRYGENRTPPKDGGPLPTASHYKYTVNDGLFRMHVLDPIRNNGELKGSLKARELVNEGATNPITDIEYDVDEDTIVLIEGIYLFKENTRDYYDEKIFLDADDDTVRERGLARNSGERSDKKTKPPEAYLKDINERYLPGIAEYQNKDLPNGYASVLIESNAHGYRIMAASPR